MKILNRWSLNVIFECEKETIKETAQDANLRGANLIGADLRGADLIGANLRGANLIGADLIGADLIGANLIGADLRGADLIGANLIGADLRGADLIGANLRDANLRDADLIGANLIQITLPHYQVIVQKTHTRIGCQYFSNIEWKEFDDKKINDMDSDALRFWNSFKAIIFSAMDSLQENKQS